MSWPTHGPSICRWFAENPDNYIKGIDSAPPEARD